MSKKAIIDMQRFPTLMKTPPASLMNTPPNLRRNTRPSHLKSLGNLVAKPHLTWTPEVEASAISLIKKMKGIDPIRASHVVYRCHPNKGLQFFRFCETNYNIKHLPIAYFTLVESLTSAGMFEEALIVFRDAIAHRMQTCVRLFNRFLNTLIDAKRIDEAAEFFNFSVIETNMVNVFSFNIMMKGLCLRDRQDEGIALLETMSYRNCRPDAVTYNTLIAGLFRTRRLKDVEAVLSEAVFEPDQLTYRYVVQGYCDADMPYDGERMLKRLTQMVAWKPDIVSYNILLNGFFKVGDLTKAYSLFRDLQGVDAVTYNTVINGFCEAGEIEKAMELFHELPSKDLPPSVSTFSSTIDTLCKVNSPVEARELLRIMKEKGIKVKTHVYNPIIDAYVKAGDVAEAVKIFKEMQVEGCFPDRITYTILIIGYCIKGHARKALMLFDLMLEVGCRPDDIVVVRLISGLVKSGLPHEGLKVLQTVMSKGCTPELSGRVGEICEIFREAKGPDLLKSAEALMILYEDKSTNMDKDSRNVDSNGTEGVNGNPSSDLVII